MQYALMKREIALPLLQTIWALHFVYETPTKNVHPQKVDQINLCTAMPPTDHFIQVLLPDIQTYAHRPTTLGLSFECPM